MPYIPLTRIKTNQYTAGNEFQLNGENYVGYYHQYYNGSYFTQPTPNYENVQKLTLIGSLSDTLVEPDLKNLTSVNNKIVPRPYAPQPTQQQYQTGQFQRYFAKKINQNIYTEIDQQTFNGLNSQDSNYLWENYLAFSLPWQLTGQKQQVETTNKNITLYTEKQLKIVGLAKFLKFNFSQFFLQI